MLKKEINNYITEFETVFNGEPWYGKPLMAVIGDTDPAIVFNKPNPGGHSIYEIVHHLYAWRELMAKRLNGDSKSKISMNSADDWGPLPKVKNKAAWEALIKKLEQNQQDLLKGLAKWNDPDLDEKFAGTDYTLRIFLNGQIQHDIYHIGQIALAIKNS